MTDVSSIGRYDLLEVVATGQLATVYSAVDPRAGRRVILKLCTAADEILRMEFLRQAELNAGLEHSHIVPVLDLGREDGMPWLVEEDPGGESLADLIARGTPVPELRRLDDLLKVAVALEHAHAQGVLHKGLSAGTVWRSEAGEVWVADFGLARFVVSGERLPSPEQVLGRAPDPRSDVFCFGALAFELLAGSAPFPGDEPSVRAARLLEGRPRSLKEVWPACPAELANLVDRCLKTHPDRRPQEMVEIVSELGFIVASPRAETFPALDLAAPGERRAERAGDAAETSPGPAAGGAGGRPVAATPPPRDEGRGARPRRWRKDLRRAGRLLGLPGRLFARLPLRHRLGVGVGMALIVFLTVWWLAGEDPPGAGEATAAPTPAAVRQADPSAPAGLEAVRATGRLVIDARPWARIVELEGPGGPVALADGQRATPVEVALPPGAYRVTLLHPGADSPVQCAVRVPAWGRVHCEAVLLSPGTDDYFRAAGWWR